MGLFQAAHGGTIFLDEIGDLPLSLQVKLLRIVQEKSFKPVGGTQEIRVDVRIISATNINLEEMVINGAFREDLFYRLNVIQVRIPPLRERKMDIPLLARHLLMKYSQELGKKSTGTHARDGCSPSGRLRTAPVFEDGGLSSGYLAGLFEGKNPRLGEISLPVRAPVLYIQAGKFLK